MKKYLLVIIAVLVLIVSGCVEEEKTISFDNDQVILQINESKPLPLTSNLSFNEITFTYSNNNIISITDGIIIPLSIGETVVTASYKNNDTIKDTINVKVTDILPEFQITKTVLELGQTVKISLSNYNKDDFNWEVSDNTVINLTNSFIIESLAIGTSTITVTKKDNPQITASILIEVIPVVPNVSATINVLRVGDKTQLVITNLEETGYAIEDYDFTISDNSVISIDEDLIVTGLKVGEVVVTAKLKANEKSYNSYTFKVVTPTEARTTYNEPAEGPLIFEMENPQGLVNAGEELDVQIVGGNSKYNYYWLPDDTTICRVTETGRVLGAKAGRTKVVVLNKENEQIRGEFYVTVTGTPNVNYRDRIAEIGLAENGYVEGPDNANKYGVWYRYNNVAWCAIFVSWCANEAGIGTDVITRYCLCSEAVRWFEKQGRYEYRGDYQPIRGDIIFFQSEGNISHTGIVTGCDGTYVYTIEGNTSNMVHDRKYLLTDTYIHGYGIPNYPEYND